MAMISGHYQNRYKFQSEEITEAIDLGSSWSREMGVERVYEHTFEFMKAYRELNSLLAKKSDQKLWDFASHSDFILLSDKGFRLNEKMLLILAKVRGTDIYYDFLLKIIKGGEFYASRNNEGGKL